MPSHWCVPLSEHRTHTRIPVPSNRPPAAERMYGLPISHDQIVRVSVTILAVLAVFSALKIGAEIFAPLLLAVITGVMTAPVTDSLERLRLPTALAALLVLLGGVFLLAALTFFAEPLIWRIADELPKIKWEVRGWIEEFRGIIRGLDEVNKQVEEALGTELNASDEGDSAPVPSLTSALFLAPQLMAQILILSVRCSFFCLRGKGSTPGFRRSSGVTTM